MKHVRGPPSTYLTCLSGFHSHTLPLRPSGFAVCYFPFSGWWRRNCARVLLPSRTTRAPRVQFFGYCILPTAICAYRRRIFFSSPSCFFCVYIPHTVRGVFAVPAVTARSVPGSTFCMRAAGAHATTLVPPSCVAAGWFCHTHLPACAFWFSSASLATADDSTGDACYPRTP